ncbi:MerR family transcriptional regulator [Promicromonospora sukumoe]|uniref:helix-turn-helix domain-containing protein n=1 Tax=Promicromonospora sukumoe TaxID=88382 RepID=UPI00365457C1
MNTTDDTLYPIGDVARRTGLSVSAIRFYSDEGIVAPTDVTPAGHRLYGMRAIAALEFIRTLRDLGTGLDQVRRLLAGETTLPYLLAEHLDVVERQEHDLRARRTVLRALVSHDDPADRIRLMSRLVTMPDADRERLVTDFWQEVGADLPADAADRVRAERPRLPSDPTAAQLDAWVTLAELLQDDDFRRATRSYLRDTYATDVGAMVSTPRFQGFVADAGADLMPRLIAAHATGLSPQDPHARQLAARLVEQTAAAVGATPDEHLWEVLAQGFVRMPQTLHEALNDPEYTGTHGRYLALVATINGQPSPDAELESALSPTGRDTTPESELGVWLAHAVRAARPSSA